jgi:hypothetical protein
MGTGGPFSGGKMRPGRDAEHSPPSSAEVKNEEELYLSPQAPPWCAAGSPKKLCFRSRNLDVGNLKYLYIFICDTGRSIFEILHINCKKDHRTRIHYILEVAFQNNQFLTLTFTLQSLEAMSYFLYMKYPCEWRNIKQLIYFMLGKEFLDTKFSGEWCN